MNILNGFNASAASPYVFKYLAFTIKSGDVYSGEIELVFSQSSNPLTTYNSVVYTYISGVGDGVNGFCGLSLSSSTNTVIDGSPDIVDVYWCKGNKLEWWQYTHGLDKCFKGFIIRNNFHRSFYNMCARPAV
jgi:hypothetical protein